MSNISEDRRSKRRYPIELPVRYRVLKSASSLASGVGRTRDISSGGVAFASEAELPAGSVVELWIAWPVEAQEVELRISGRIVRSSATEAAIQTKRYDFVTFRREVEADNRSVSGRSKAANHNIPG